MATMPEGQMSRKYLAAWDPRSIELNRRTTDAVHAHGTAIFAQLNHGGHTSLEHPPPILWAPTQMPEPSSMHTAKAMDATDMARTVEGFAVSTRNLVDAGYDGIEIKIAHDGLLRSFASPFFNRRTDKYGGSFENRMRFPLECAAAVREALADHMPLGIRLCLHEYTPFGYELDYGLRMAEHLEASGLVDYFNCDAGSFSSFWMEIPPARPTSSGWPVSSSPTPRRHASSSRVGRTRCVRASGATTGACTRWRRRSQSAACRTLVPARSGSSASDSSSGPSSRARSWSSEAGPQV